MDRRLHPAQGKWARSKLLVLTGIMLPVVLLVMFVLERSVESQEETWWGPSVRVLAEVEGFVFDWSPDGQRFAYADESGIMLREAPDFRKPRRKSLPGWDGTAPITDLRWSPDGSRLAFVSPWKPGDWTTVWLSEPEAPVRDLLPPEVSNVFGSPGVRTLALGPWLNEREIVFEQHCGTECVAVHKIQVDTRDYGTLCLAGVDGGIHWSPRRDRGIISGHNGALALAMRENFRPVVADSSPESSCREVFPGCSDEVRVSFSFDSWSPDGKQVLLTGHSCRSGMPGVESGKRDLFLWKIDNDTPERIGANGTLGAWSPDGLHIGFILLGDPADDPQSQIVQSDLNTREFLEGHLGVMDVATKSPRLLTSLGLIALNRAEEWPLFRPVWSPDGQRIAYRDGRNNLYVVRRDGSDRRLLVREKLSIPYWSPDSKRLAIRVGKDPNYWVGVENPYVVELD